jgi:hypothetical protein
MWARKPADDPEPIARLCLSCHQKDGLAGDKLIGAHDRTHPYKVSMLESTVADGETILPLFSSTGVKIADGKSGNVTCSSCHAVHRWDPIVPGNKGSAKTEGTAANSCLRIKNDVGSPLCYDCHLDKSLIELTDHDRYAETAERGGA